MADQCSRCGAKFGFFSAEHSDPGTSKPLCFKCFEERILERAKIEKDRRARITEASKKIILTTTPNIDGCRVIRYVGIESVEFVIGTGLFSEMTSDFADFFGRRSTAFEQKLREAKTYALEAMRMIAAEREANAVVAIDLDYTEFSGNRVALILNGTLVVAKPIDTARREPGD